MVTKELVMLWSENQDENCSNLQLKKLQKQYIHFLSLILIFSDPILRERK